MGSTTVQMRAITVFNQKGGVGKTATASNLARALNLQGQRLLLLDTDPQAHLSVSLLGGKSPRAGFAELISGDVALADTLHHVSDDVALIPAGYGLAAGITSSQSDSLEALVREIFQHASEKEHVLIVDCPPTINAVTTAIIRQAPTVLIPVASDFLAMQGLSDILKTIKQIEQEIGKTIDYRVVLTRFDARRRLSLEVRDRITAYFPGRVAPDPIRESVAIAEAPGFGMSVIDYKPASNGAEDYKSLARYIAASPDGDHQHG